MPKKRYVTIPMMKRAGYGATLAAAVEATAMIGGQIMPPIMAAAAFIMADLVGVPFRQIALAALIPAVLYFFCVYITVHFEARRLGLRKIPSAEIPSFTGTLRRDGYLLLPVAALVWYLYQGFTEEMAGLMAIATTYVMSFVRKSSALTPVRLLQAIETGARAAVVVAMAVAAAGLIIGGLFLSGIGMKFSEVLLHPAAALGRAAVARADLRDLRGLHARALAPDDGGLPHARSSSRPASWTWACRSSPRTCSSSTWA